MKKRHVITLEAGSGPNIVFIAVVFCLLAVSVWLVFAAVRRDRRGDSGDSGRAVEYSGESGRTAETIGNVSERLGELAEVLGTGFTDLQDGLGYVSVRLGEDAGDIRQFAVRLREIAETVKEMEGRIVYLDRCLGEFLDWYYDTLDAEIERETGIKLP